MKLKRFLNASMILAFLAMSQTALAKHSRCKAESLMKAESR